MNMLKHFENEVELLGWNDTKNFDDKDGYEMQQYMVNGVKDVLKVIAEQGHSGFSIGIFKSLLNKAIDFKPLGALTGEDEEWNKIDSKTYQNKRFGEVFKNSKDGEAYHSAYYLFKDDGGGTWTNGYSRRKIEFPYNIPKTKPVIVIEGDLCTVDEDVCLNAVKEYEESIN